MGRAGLPSDSTMSDASALPREKKYMSSRPSIRALGSFMLNRNPYVSIRGASFPIRSGPLETGMNLMLEFFSIAGIAAGSRGSSGKSSDGDDCKGEAGGHGRCIGLSG